MEKAETKIIIFAKQEDATIGEALKELKTYHKSEDIIAVSTSVRYI